VSWTRQHRSWVRRQRLSDPPAQPALEPMLGHPEAIDAQLAAVEHELAEIAEREPWCDPLRWLWCFRGSSTLTALGLLAEIGDFRRFASARELMSFVGLTPSEYSSGGGRHRGHITKCGNVHAAACWSKPPGTTSTRPGSPSAAAGTSPTSRPRYSPASGGRSSGSTTATAR
jgi:transposase